MKMKTLKLWKPAIVFGLIAAAAKFCDTWFNVNGTGFFLSSEICSAIFMAVLFLLFVLGKIISAPDRKNFVTGKPEKSFFSGLFGFIASVGLVGSGIISMMSLNGAENMLLSTVVCFSSLLAGVVLLYESCISLTGQNGMKNHPLMTLFVPFWAGARLVSLFVDYSKVSIHSTEMFDIFSTSFLLMFLYYQAMYFSEISPKTAIRKMGQYGIIFFVCAAITTADIILKMIFPAPQTTGIDTLIIQPTVSRILICAIDIAFCFYALFLTHSACKKADVKEVENDDEEIDEDTEFLGSLRNMEDDKDDTHSPESILHTTEEVTVKEPEKPSPEPEKPAEVKKEEQPAEKKEPKKTEKPEPTKQQTQVITPSSYSAEDIGLPTEPQVKKETPPPAPKSDDDYNELFKMLDAMSTDE